MSAGTQYSGEVKPLPGGGNNQGLVSQNKNATNPGMGIALVPSPADTKGGLQIVSNELSVLIDGLTISTTSGTMGVTGIPTSTSSGSAEFAGGILLNTTSQALVVGFTSGDTYNVSGTIIEGDSSSAITNTTLASVFTVSGTLIGGSSPLQIAGRVMRLTAEFTVSAAAANTVTLAFGFNLSGLTGSPTLFTLSTLAVGSLSAAPILVEAMIYVTSSGTTIKSYGKAFVNGVVTAIPTTAASGGSLSSSSATLNVAAKWSVASASDTITLDNLVLEIVN